MTLKTLALLLHIYTACNMPQGLNLHSFAATIAYLEGTIGQREFIIRSTLPDSRMFAHVSCIITEKERYT